MDININRGEILNVASNQDVFLRGEKYYKEGKVLKIDFIKKGNADVVVASVAGNYKNYVVYLTFTEKGKIESYSCNCEAHSIWRGSCKHVICALLSLIDSNSKSADQVRTSRVTKELALLFEKSILEDINKEIVEDSDPENQIRVVPMLTVDYTKQPFLSFSIGTKKLYKIKNILEFIDNVENSRLFSYGKGLEFFHKPSMFDEESLILIDFIKKEHSSYFDVYKKLTQGLFISSQKAKSKNLDLFQNSLDEFFKLYKNKTIAADLYNFSVDEITLIDSGPDIQFHIEAVGENIVLTGVKLNYLEFRGAAYNYLLIRDKMYKVNKSYIKALISILKALNSLDVPQIIFGGDDRQKFLSFIYPKLLDYNLIDENSKPLDMLADFNLVTKLYFDVDKAAVNCKLLFCYGETEINPIQANNQVTYRNIVEEYKISHRLKMYGFEESKAKGMYVLSDEDKIYNFYYTGLDEIRSKAEVFATDSFTNKSIIPKTTKANYGVRIAGNLLELSIDTSYYTIKELMEAANSFHLKKKYHRLKDGRYISLENEDIIAAENIISSLDLTQKELANGKIVLPKYRALYLENVVGEAEKLTLSKDTAYKRLTQDFKNYEDLDFEIPGSLADILRNYQKIGFNWLRILAHYGFGGILADDMGLGKTLEVIAVILSELPEKKQPSLVVTPTSLMYNWEKEIKKFAKEIKTVVIAGLPAARKELLENAKDVDVFITTYDMLKRDIENYEHMKFRYVVADEAQYIKNPMTQNAKTLKQLNSECRFALTGTPIENSLVELWSIFDFIMPGFLLTASKFSKLYENPIIKNEDTDKANALQKQISPFILRRLKKDVLKELPNKLETILYAEMETEQKKIYAAHLLKARGELEDVIKEGQFAKSQIQILAQLTRLRQICCHPSLFIEDYKGGSGKLDLAIETICRAKDSGHRVLVFSQFTSMLNILKKALSDGDVSYFYLDGSTKAQARLEMVDQFNNGSKDVFLISLKAGGTGLNLTGADVVIHYDPWWNPAVMDQASDRAHRFGQKNIVQVINIVTKDTIEEKILELQAKKKNLVDSVIKEGASFINKMSQEEIRDLFMV